MSIPLEFDMLCPLIICPYIISLGIIVLLRIRSVKEKLESFVFFILCLAAAAWSLGPFVTLFIPAYGWISAVFITNMAMIYMLLITSMQWIKLFLPLSLISSGSIIYFLINNEASQASFPLKFAMAIFPLLILINIVIYHYYYKHKTKFHLTIGIMCSFMILGGFYDTFKLVNKWPLIPAASLSSFAFVIVWGYYLLFRGYLQLQGWQDYALELEQKEKLLSKQFQVLYKANIDSVIVLSQTIEAKDPYTRGHCLRVRDFAKAIGREMGFDKERLLYLELGALLHDIGKIGISVQILNKKEKLSIAEYNEIKKHPDIGADIVSNVDFFKPIIPIIRYHHEFFNGLGYPTGLKENSIPIESRILFVGDVFDAMTSDRPYRRAYSIEKALATIKEVSGSQLDPEIVELFISKKIYLTDHSVSDKIILDF